VRLAVPMGPVAEGRREQAAQRLWWRETLCVRGSVL